jgi:tRNA-dihydrouridine synthase 3
MFLFCFFYFSKISQRNNMTGACHVKILPEYYRKTHAETLPGTDSHPEEPAPEAPRTKKRGQNKGRKFARIQDSLILCRSILSTGVCAEVETCKNSHDIPAYLAEKGADIGTVCYLFDTFGFCKYGLGCRFAGAHIGISHSFS